MERARAQQKEYGRKGAARTTLLLVQAIQAGGVDGQTVLDIGGGLGAIQHKLLAAGASQATHVDASTAYLNVAREEAERRDLAERIIHLRGDFVDLAPQIPPADIVSLDRVICCYDDMQALVRLSAQRARRRYGLVYPRDTWWLRAGIRLADLFLRLFGSQFQVYAHRTRAVETILQEEGLERVYYRRAGVWQVAVYARQR
jgi:predicted TPR repeat methyltransferase